MTDLANQRRLAAEVMDIGVNRVWMNPEAYKDISQALTREDIRNLITEKKIGKRAIRGVSRHTLCLRGLDLSSLILYGIDLDSLLEPLLRYLRNAIPVAVEVFAPRGSGLVRSEK